MGHFERALVRGVVGPLERAVGETAVLYTSKDRQTTLTIPLIFNEQVGALDPFSNGVFHIRTDLVVPERNATLTLDGEVWSIVDVRDARDGTCEVRCIKPEITP